MLINCGDGDSDDSTSQVARDRNPSQTGLGHQGDVLAYELRSPKSSFLQVGIQMSLFLLFSILFPSLLLHSRGVISMWWSLFTIGHLVSVASNPRGKWASLFRVKVLGLSPGGRAFVLCTQLSQSLCLRPGQCRVLMTCYGHPCI